MRQLSSKQLSRIFQGEDLEFRITGYAFKHLATIQFEDLIFPYDLNFKNSVFSSLSFVNCIFQGKLNFIASTLDDLCFERCEFKDIDVKSSKVKSISLNNSSSIQKFHVGGSCVNTIDIKHNKIFEAIELGCENHIVSASIEENGHAFNDSSKSTIYICPEKFDSIKLKNNTSQILHIGTIGEYATFEIQNYNANLILFSNCNSDSSKVNFRKVLPIDPQTGSVCIFNSSNILEMHDNGLFSEFKHVKNYQQMQDFSKHRGIAS